MCKRAEITIAMSNNQRIIHVNPSMNNYYITTIIGYPYNPSLLMDMNGLLNNKNFFFFDPRVKVTIH